MRRAFLGTALLVALSLCGCVSTGTEFLSEMGLPTDRQPARVLDRVQHGAYVLTTLEIQGQPWRFLFPSNSECFQTLQIPGTVEYWRQGRIGDFVRGATHCEAIGVASLESWRDRAARPVSAVLPASEDATFAPFYVDAGVILVRGSLPQVTRIGWRPTDNVVAMLPRNPACEHVASVGAGKLKYYASGFPAFTISDGDQHCAVLGLADPV